MQKNQNQTWFSGPVDGTVFAVLMAAAAFLGRENPRFVYPEVLFSFLLVLGFNFLNFSVLPRFMRESRRAALAVANNIVLLSVVVHFSGGPQSYFWVLYLLPVFNACLSLSASGVLAATGAVVALLLAFHRDAWASGHAAALLELMIKTAVISSSALVVMRVATREREALGRLEEQRVRAEQEKAEAREQLVVSDRRAILGTLCASITHELSTPLAAILGYSQVALSQDLPPADILRFFGRIQDCAQRCRKIMQDTLDFSRQNSGESRPCDINALLRDCLQLVKNDWLAYDITVEAELAEDLPPVPCFPAELQQVVFNLLSNAGQAIRGSGRKDGRIRLRSRLEGGSATVSVEDNGPGVPYEHAERIWEPFFTTKPAGEGTGLGLAICRQIVAHHGGKLSLEAAPEGGAIFRVQLPLNPAVLPAVDADSLLGRQTALAGSH
jgi:signal transduction histidine kinase